jgi:peroxiredoxin/tetratricopeptide (TPR) repeat protein
LHKRLPLVVFVDCMKRLLILFACAAVLRADDVPLGPDGKPKPGHSTHGEVFDEGPRQAGALLPGIGNAHFEITTKNAEAQKFFDQGVGQLHGFWYFEAERSFRMVAKVDPDCAMAYWGLAIANLNNEKRTADFIKEAMKRRDKASPREQAWIDAFHAYLSDGKKRTAEKRKALVKALEKIVFEYPDDLEAKAFLVFQLWENSQNGVALNSHTAVDAIAQAVLAKNPQHPGIHHYLVHLWNHEDDRRALKSAAVLGQTAPGIAHMWHMPGHTFTKLKRFGDAAWQQEASARTDHAQMITARILPEQIHNYAHNNDWLVENLGYVGRVREAIDLSRNMIELPRLAPGHQLIGRDGYAEARSGFQFGRRRLVDLLLAWNKWEDLLAFDGTSYLEPSDDPQEDARRLRAVGIAAFQSGNKPKGEEKLAAIEHLIKTAREQRYTAADEAERSIRKSGKGLDDIAKAVADIYKKNSDKVDALEKHRSELRVYQALAENKPMIELKPLLDEAKDISPLRASRIHLKLGDMKKAEELAERVVKDGAGQVLPLANLADIQWRAGNKDAAKKTFEKLRPLCAQADLGEITFTRLKPIVDDLKLPADWRPKLAWPADSGERPDLAKLGPFRWRPQQAPSWEAPDQAGKVHSLAEHKGKPMLLVFYLGSGCSHCIEQLNLLGPLAKDYSGAGVEIVAVSTDNATELNKTFVQAKDAQGFPFPIVADPTFGMFKAYRTFDDFENQPLHGTFLIDGAGYVRWQDISFKPFTDLKWLLTESKRLLALPVAPEGVISQR